jgi:hypothetical protein
MHPALRKGALRLAALAAPLIASAAIMPASAHGATIDLGDAGKYAVFALDSFQYNGPGKINGDVAVGKSTNFASPAVINGTVFLNTGVSKQGNIVPTGGFVTRDLSSAISDALSEANTLRGLTATQTVGTLGNNSSLTGNGGVNVINTSGINMSNGTLTLNGSASDVFVINDAGGFKSSNSSMVLNGVTANHVLFNITGNVAITGGGGNNFYGTILAPLSDVSVHDKTLTGAIIGNTISDTSGFTVNGTKAVPAPAPLVASAALLALLGLGWLWQQGWMMPKSA